MNLSIPLAHYMSYALAFRQGNTQKVLNTTFQGCREREHFPFFAGPCRYIQVSVLHNVIRILRFLREPPRPSWGKFFGCLHQSFSGNHRLETPALLPIRCKFHESEACVRGKATTDYKETSEGSDAESDDVAVVVDSALSLRPHRSWDQRQRIRRAAAAHIYWSLFQCVAGWLI